MKHLQTQTLDIHAGGRDLIFPHHENEIAQSEALTGKPFAKYWIHHGLLTINSQKMSKSLGNFISIKDILSQYTPDEVKMFFLFSHYRSPIDFSDTKMDDAKKALEKFDVLFYRAAQVLDGQRVDAISAGFITKYKHEFMEAMDDDFNTPKAMAALFGLVNDTNTFIDQNEDDPNYLGVITHAVDALDHLARNVFGLFEQETEKTLTEQMAAWLQERQDARAKKDFKRSDELRMLLKANGILVEDGKSGQTWRWV